MTSSAQRKGSRAELEAAHLLAELTGWPVRRKLGAGRLDDTGDLDGIPNTTIQVKNYADPLRAIREGLPALRTQQTNAASRYGALLVRRRGGHWTAVMDIDQLATLLTDANRQDT